MTPKLLHSADGVKVEWLISYDDTPCFAEKRYTLTGGKAVLGYAPAVWTVVDGAGSIEGEGWSREVKKGDYFFLPRAAEGKFFLTGELVAVECLPSLQD